MILNKTVPLLSIVSPILNVVEFIEQSIQSVITQLSNLPVEYIIVDGASTDGTVETIKKYNKYISQWISEKDKGQSDALNKAIRLASGKYILWLNGDDCLATNSLSPLIHELRNLDDHTLICGNMLLIDAASKPIETNIITYELSFDSLLNSAPYFPTNAIIYPREFFSRNGYFQEDLHYVMDYELILRLTKHYEFRYVDIPVVLLRRHSMAKSIKNRIQFDLEREKVRYRYGGKIFSRASLYTLKRLGKYVKLKVSGKL